MIDKTAIIHPTAKIADDAIIGPYVVIGENVTIGHRTRVISNAHIEFAEIGDDCTISPFATIGSEPQDLGYKGEETKVVIGDGTIIKENVTIHRGAACGDFTTRIGKKCLLMVGSHVAHNCVLADEVILANLVTLGGHVHVGFGAFVGGMSVFHQNIRIGDMAIISGFSASRRSSSPGTAPRHWFLTSLTAPAPVSFHWSFPRRISKRCGRVTTRCAFPPIWRPRR